MGTMRNAYKILVGEPEWKRNSEDLTINERRLKLSLEKWGWRLWIGFISSE
jgi:hypothetical protein